MNLAFGVLKQIGLCTVKNADFAGYECGCMFAVAQAPAACFNSDKSNVFIIDEIREHAYCVGASTHTSHNHIRQPA